MTESLFIPVYSTKSEEEFIIAKSLLENSNIKFMTRNELVSRPGIGGNLTIEVVREDESEAKEILQHFINGSEVIPIDTDGKKAYDQKNEFNYAMTIGSILLIVILIVIAVIFLHK